MAQRRMFSPDIVSSDAFLEMPPSTQALYFQLGMKADDDGFVNPKMVMRTIGSTEDELKVLIGKRFVLPFENGVIVIKHWKINNLVRKDWYRPTIYVEQKEQLFIKPNGIYTTDKSKGIPLIENGSSTKCQRVVNVGKVRIGKDRIGKISKDNNKQGEQSSQDELDPINQVFEVFYKTVNPAINYGHKTNRAAADWMIKKWGLENVIRIAEYACSVQGQPYAPTITTPGQLKEKTAQLKIYKEKKENNSQDNKIKFVG